MLSTIVSGEVHEKTPEKTKKNSLKWPQRIYSMKIDTIVCHHKGTFLVNNTIKSLLAQKNVNLEILVVSSVINAEFYGAKTIYCKGLPAEKRNVGVSYSDQSSIYLAFFDDDIYAKSD